LILNEVQKSVVGRGINQDCLEAEIKTQNNSTVLVNRYMFFNVPFGKLFLKGETLVPVGVERV
jgi:hypothetical protein